MSLGGIPSTRELIRELRNQHWRVEQTASNHFKGFAPDGCTLITFCDTSEPRAMKNNLSDLRRTGQFQWPPPPRRAAPSAPDAGDDVARISTTEAVPPPATAPDLDALFQNLKAAKSELTTMESKHASVLEAVQLAQLALSEAHEQARRSAEELDLAHRLVKEAKAEFDAAFESSAA